MKQYLKEYNTPFGKMWAKHCVAPAESPDDDTPAIVYNVATLSFSGRARYPGTKVWSKGNHILHRVGGPAVIHPFNVVQYWLDGEEFRKVEDWEEAKTARGYAEVGRKLILDL